jgi:uncharacterized protein (TIGR04255 family)
MKEQTTAPMRPQLANSPLVEAVFEVRFPGHFSVLNRLGQFQSAIQKEFPNLFVPTVPSGPDPSALMPYRFVSSDQSESLQVAVNRFALVWKRYSVFEAFRSRFLDLFGRFRSQAYDPPTFTRMGLRYMNVFPAQPASIKQFHPWLAIGLNAPSLASQNAEQITGSVNLVFPEGRLRVYVGDEPTGLQNIGFPANALAGTFALDLDFYTGGPVPSGDLEVFLDAAHKRVDDAFFGLVTEEALKVLGGEP